MYRCLYAFPPRLGASHKRRQFFKARAKAWVSSNEKEAFAILFFRFRFKHDYLSAAFPIARSDVSLCRLWTGKILFYWIIN